MGTPKHPTGVKSWLKALAKRAITTFGLWPDGGQSGYAGGALNRLNADWVLRPMSPDQELRTNILALRARARQLVRDDPFAKRFIQLCAANIMGPKGIRLQGNVRMLSGDPSTQVNDVIEQEWERWGRAGNCTADGRLSFREFERLLAKSLPQDGEVLIRLIPYFPGNPWAFTVQLLDPDQLDHQLNEAAKPGHNAIRMGIEVDEWNRPVAYHIWTSHPSEYEYATSRERRRIPAAEIIHLFIPHRVSQARGVTWFHPVLMCLKMYDGYQEAELVAARSGAAKPFWIITKGDAAAGYVPPETEDRRQMEIEPGLATELDPGKEVQFSDPTHPTNAFEPFTKMILKAVSTGLGVTHASLSGDLSEANYSSLRAGLLPERDEWRIIQDYFVEHCHRRIYETWLDMALLTGRLKAGMRDPEALKDVRFEPRGWAWVDPKNEIDAHVVAIANGLQTRQNVLADNGLDLEETFEQLGKEDQIAAEHNINVTPTARTNPAAAAPPDQAGEAGQDPKKLKMA